MVPLTRLFYALFIRRNATDMKFENGEFQKTYSFPLLMLIDEMPLLRKLPIIQEALGYVAGYGIRMFMLAQDIAQVEEINGDKQTIDSGASTRIVFAPNKGETADKLASLSGKTTITEEKVSHSHDKVGLKGGSVSINTEKIERDLMTKSEFMSLHDHDMVIFSKGQPPIYGRKAFYYENPEMVARTRIAPPAKTDVLRQQATADKAAFNPTNILEANSVNERENVKSQHEEWNNDRNDLRDRINAMLGGDNSNNSQTQELADQEPVKEKKLAGSVYLKNKQILSEDERRDINEMTNDISLYQQVVALSAFE
jgi:type IV secretion system protein VirD4